MMPAMRYPIAYDFSRLASRIYSATPNGIDRVDQAYASYFLNSGDSESRGVLYLGPLGMRVTSGAQAARAISGIDAHYGETGERAAVDAGLLRAIAEWTNGQRERDDVRPSAVRGRRTSRIDVARFTIRTLGAAGRHVSVGLPQGARYLCVSQFPLSEHGAFDWLQRRPDVKAIFFIHDLLPLQFPEYFRPSEPARHRRRLEKLAKYGSAALVSTRQVALELRAELNRLGRPDLPVQVAPVPLAAGFVPGPLVPELAGAKPYFIHCGTIEPRKNHLTLLTVWRELAAEFGAHTPKLILVGARGWENENVLDLLDRSPAIRRHVVELPNINTPTLVEILRGARALLMPSFGEGYGLPVAEAQSLDVPVIASAIPVFDEVMNGMFTAVHPIDGRGWLSAIRNAAAAAPRAAWGGTPGPAPGPLSSRFAELQHFMNEL